jgi:hypothetical protein
MSSPDTQALEALLARVEAATRPDREIDGEIAQLCGWLKTPLDWTDNFGTKRNLPPPYTSSLDAIAALAETELPVWWWGGMRSTVSALGEANLPGNALPRYVVAAFLRAMIAERPE